MGSSAARRAVLLLATCEAHTEAPQLQAQPLARASVELQQEAEDEETLEAQLVPKALVEEATDANAPALPPPRIISRSATTVTVWPQPLPQVQKQTDNDDGYADADDRTSRRPHTYRVYGKQAGAGTAVSLTNDDFDGLGVDISASVVESGAAGAVAIVRGLEPNERYVFAVAAYDEKGALIGRIGATSTQVVTALPLPLLLLWGDLCVAACSVGWGNTSRVRRALGTAAMPAGGALHHLVESAAAQAARSTARRIASDAAAVMMQTSPAQMAKTARVGGVADARGMPAHAGAAASGAAGAGTVGAGTACRRWPRRRRSRGVRELHARLTPTTPMTPTLPPREGGRGSDLLQG